eukprot:gene3857-6354_t
MVLSLTYEGFQAFITLDPIPHVVVDARADKSKSIPFVKEQNTKVVSLDSYTDELVPEDGCVIVVTSENSSPSISSERAIVYYNTLTRPSSSPFTIEFKDCSTIMSERKSNVNDSKTVGSLVVLDVRRTDEVENFGTLKSAYHIPLHSLLQQIGQDTLSENLQAILTSTRPIVLSCRTSRRAKFSTQLLHDLGVKQVFCLDKGACGLSKFPENEMKCYKSYEISDAIPPPSDEP